MTLQTTYSNRKIIRINRPTNIKQIVNQLNFTMTVMQLNQRILPIRSWFIIPLMALCLMAGCKKDIGAFEDNPVLVIADSMCFSAKVSPNGQYVAYVSRKNTFNPKSPKPPAEELFLVNSDGSNYKELILKNEIDSFQFSLQYIWSQSSNYLLVFSELMGLSAIWKFLLIWLVPRQRHHDCSGRTAFGQ
jgi:hypothetical protein